MDEIPTTGESPPVAPGGIVYLPQGTFWVHETPEEIKHKREFEVDEGMIRLTGLESGSQSGMLSPYELHVNPMFMVGFRSFSQEAFENFIKPPAPEAPPQEEGLSGGFVIDLGALMRRFGGGRLLTPDDECIHCPHPAAAHAGMVGPCQEKNCKCDHFHPREDDDGPQGNKRS